jgi:hypothetical protein
MRNVKMTISEDGIYPTKNKEMFYARNDMHIYYSEVANVLEVENSDILEIGFGMGICSREIQKLNPKSHTIIEINKDIYNYGLEWSKSLSNVKMLLGNWSDIIPTLNQKYDGIFIDTIEDGEIWDFERYASMVSKIGTKLSMLHYGKVNNKNINYKMVNGKILNWSIFDGHKFTNNQKKTGLI